MKYKIALKYIIILVTILVAGCAGKNKTITLPTTPIVYKQGQEVYLLQPGDNLDIKFYYNPELNENVTIRPDGKISLQIIDELQAAGLTPAQLDESLTRAYSSQLKQPKITVMVKSFGGQRIYVGGEVKSPQVLTVIGQIDAMQAIFNTGGFTKDAKLSSVMIISKGKDNQPIARKVDLKKVLSGEATGEDFTLKPFDMVYVPKTELAQADEFMAHIYNLIPRNVYVSFTYDLNKTKTRNNIDNQVNNQGTTYTIDDLIGK
jgi:protein involved in polysaccharide export with SLBB domain